VGAAGSARHPLGRRPIRVAVASSATEARATAAGFEVVQMEGSVTLDVVVDGADQVDSDRNLIKGHGAALLREKLVVAAARRFLVVAERSKLTDRLGMACSCRWRWCALPGPRPSTACWTWFRRPHCGATATAPPWSPTKPTTSSTAPCPLVLTSQNWRRRSRRRWAWSSTGCPRRGRRSPPRIARRPYRDALESARLTTRPQLAIQLQMEQVDRSRAHVIDHRCRLTTHDSCSSQPRRSPAQVLAPTQ
jgi:hypothetical protein